MDFIKKQFEFSRKNLLKDIEGASKEIFDVQPAGYNNHIHWHLGHILTSAEQFLFGPNGELPAEYGELFGYGSRPANWNNDVPAVETLVEQLKSQLSRIQEIPSTVFDQKLAEPVLGTNTMGELAALTAYHESYHCGQIHALKRIVEATK